MQASIQKNTQYCKVLSIEDDPIAQKVHSYILTKIGCAIDLAKNGKEALDLIYKNKDYNFILLDFYLPDTNGIELAKKLRAKKLIQQLTPIIIITSCNLVEIQQSAGQAGVNACLQKPLNQNTLMQIINEYVVAK